MDFYAHARYRLILGLLLVAAMAPVAAMAKAPLPPPPLPPEQTLAEKMEAPPASSLPRKDPVDVDDYGGPAIDHPAHRIGDAITVYARKPPHARSRSDDGAQAMDSDLITVIAAEVVAVNADGGVRIRGPLTLGIDGVQQTIQVSGLVGPEDIDPDNAVLSHRIVDAEVELIGDGLVGSSQRQRAVENMFKLLRLQRAR